MKGPLAMLAALAALACTYCIGALAADSVAAPSKLGAGDVLNRPAMMSPLASKRLLVSMIRSGDRFVAVGPRGHIVVSTDDGKTWSQAKVPVSSDLTSVYFPSATHGWAVGHDGVVLASTDGGMSWIKQLDGFAVNDLIIADLKAKVTANAESTVLAALLAEAERYKEQGADKPFLDVWFENEQHGFVVGAYNLILETMDGGKTWQSWFDRVSNPRLMNLYSIRPVAGALFMSGEAGTAFRLNPEARNFDSVPVDYAGSLFGVVDATDALLTFGLRGSLFRTADGGKSWEKIDSKLPGTIVGGLTMPTGKIVIADQGGRLAVSQDGGRSFAPLALSKAVPLTGIIDAGNGKLGLTGPFGAMVVALGASSAP